MAKEVPYKTYLEINLNFCLEMNMVLTILMHIISLTYKYQVPEFDSGIIFTLTGKKKIELTDVTKVRILEMIDFGYSSMVVNSLEKKDEKWFIGPVVRYWGIGDELNLFHVLVHKENYKLLQILKDIGAETRIYQEKVEKLENELDEMEGADRVLKEEGLEHLLAQRSQQVSDALSRLFGFKLVIIGYLSC